MDLEAAPDRPLPYALSRSTRPMQASAFRNRRVQDYTLFGQPPPNPPAALDSLCV